LDLVYYKAVCVELSKGVKRIGPGLRWLTNSKERCEKEMEGKEGRGKGLKCRPNQDKVKDIDG